MTLYLGLFNENEYYSDHYLAEVLESDLKKHSQPDDSSQSIQSLRSIARAYPSERNKLAGHKDPFKRIALQREWTSKVLKELGFEQGVGEFVLDDDGELPSLVQVRGVDGYVRLVVLEVLDEQTTDESDPLGLTPIRGQFSENRVPRPEILTSHWEHILDKHIIPMRHPPRWMLLLSASQLLLVDRYKWGEKRFLRVKFTDLFERVHGPSFRAVTRLFHCSSLVDIDGQNLADKLNANSHKHAHAVSTDLKYALRRSIELLANEAIFDLKNRLKERIYEKDEQMAAELGRECLRYMYRLLFLFFLEARPELDLVPMKSDVYLQGYSLDHLRNLELVQLTTDAARNGYYFHESLKLLFRLVREGHGASNPNEGGLDFKNPVFSQRKIDSHLFSDEDIPVLSRVRIRNHVLQQIVCEMSLSQPSKGKKWRGRISYSQLGVNQLGAVYEALLPYRGIFAEENLYEVRAESSSSDELEGTFLVRAEDIESFSEAERCHDIDENGHKRLRKHEKGSFLFRLAGRDRKKTASYYTPESLTRCVVKYALEERITPEMRAEEILKLKILEPAMGSAAFLNEAVNQLADRYLELRQLELNTRIPAADYSSEQRKVRQYIVDRNVFGVDVNPVATELGKLSLWLNCIHENGRVPWFGLQVLAGNSLLGARRAAYSVNDIRSGDWKESEPSSTESSTTANGGQQSIYHFLLPYPDMLRFAAKKNDIASLIDSDLHTEVANWRRSFNAKLTDSELEILQLLSIEIDKLWTAHTQQLHFDRTQTEDHLDYWGSNGTDSGHLQSMDYREKDAALRRGVYSSSRISESPRRRLKMAMDYWCALWFWPLDQVESLPSREQWINEICLILTGRLPVNTTGEVDLLREQEGLQKEAELANLLKEVGTLDWQQVQENYPTLKLVEEISKQNLFHHWELEFADIFYFIEGKRKRGGFDLILGNPPWVVPSFDEQGLMSEYDAKISVHNSPAPRVHSMAKSYVTSNKSLASAWFAEWQSSQSTWSFLLSRQINHALQKQRADLYKSFIVQSWRLSRSLSVIGLLHPESVYTDAKGTRLRQELYKRLRRHFQFQNEHKLFEEIGHPNTFGINIYGEIKSEPCFDHLSNLYIAEMVRGCYEHDGSGSVPGIKSRDNKWETRPHQRRVVEIDLRALGVFAGCMDSEETPAFKARLMRVHSQESLSILRKLQTYPHRAADLGDSIFFSTMWNETTDVSKNTIRRDTQFVDTWGEFIYSGPHYFVSNPFFKTPRKKCVEKSDYDVLDLTWIPDDYCSRTNYIRSCEKEVYWSRIQSTPWSQKNTNNEERELITQRYRSISRERVNPSSVRTLQFAIVPEQACHLHSSYSCTFANYFRLLDFVSFASSLICDYQVRAAGMTHIQPNVLLKIPIPNPHSSDPRVNALRTRTLGLNCLTSAYTDLWAEINCAADSTNGERFLSFSQQENWTNSSLNSNYFSNLKSSWSRNSALRTDRERRQALVEIDVLVAMIMGFTLQELIAAYREQFSVLANYERNTWYDRTGRIIHTNNVSAVPVNLPTKAKKGDSYWSIDTHERKQSRIELGWNEVKNLREGTVSVEMIDSTLPGGPVPRIVEFKAPFVRCDREADYEEAWAEFERRFSN